MKEKQQNGAHKQNTLTHSHKESKRFSRKVENSCVQLSIDGTNNRRKKCESNGEHDLSNKVCADTDISDHLYRVRVFVDFFIVNCRRKVNTINKNLAQTKSNREKERER